MYGDAIVNHTGDTLPKTLEGQIVRRCDRIAYLCHDFDDGCKVGIIGPDKLPGIVAMRLGTKPSQILDILVRNVVESSAGKQIVSMDKYYEEAMDEFRCFMFDYVYLSPPLKNTPQGRTCCNHAFGFIYAPPGNAAAGICR